MTDAEIRSLEKKIADGITPPCPSCNSTLVVSEEQTGKSGAHGKTYHCSKDREGQFGTCELKPGIAYVSWKAAFGNAMRTKAVQYVLSLSIGGVVVFFGQDLLGSGNGNNETDTTELYEKIDELNETIATQKETIEKLGTSANSSNEGGNVQVADCSKCEKEKEALEEQVMKLGDDYRTYLGMFHASRAPERYKKPQLSKNYFFEILRSETLANELSERDIEDIMGVLVSFTRESTDGLEELVVLMDSTISVEWPKKRFHQAQIYHNLYIKTQKMSFRQKAIEHYYCYLSGSERSEFSLTRKEIYTLVANKKYSNEVSEDSLSNFVKANSAKYPIPWCR